MSDIELINALNSISIGIDEANKKLDNLLENKPTNKQTTSIKNEEELEIDVKEINKVLAEIFKKETNKNKKRNTNKILNKET